MKKLDDTLLLVLVYRYYEGGMKNLVKNNNITDILFAHNVFMFNTNYTIVKERNF